MSTLGTMKQLLGRRGVYLSGKIHDVVVAAAGKPLLSRGGHGRVSFGITDVVAVAGILFEIHVVFQLCLGIVKLVIAQIELIAAVVGQGDFPYLDPFEKAYLFLSHLAFLLGALVDIARRRQDRVDLVLIVCC